VVKSSGLADELDEKEEDEDEIQANHWYVEKDRLAELALGGVKDLYTTSKEKDSEIESLKSKVEILESEMAVLKSRLANSTTQEDRIAKLEELVSKIGQGQ
jgi:phage shock protein A